MGKNKFNKQTRPQNGQPNDNATSKEEQNADIDVAVMEQEQSKTEVPVVQPETQTLQNVAADVEYLDEERTEFFLGFKYQMEAAREQMVKAKVATSVIDILLAELYSLIEEVPGEPTLTPEQAKVRMEQIEHAAAVMGIDLLTVAMPVAEEYRNLLEGTPEQTEESFRIPTANEESLNDLCESTLALGKFFRKQMIVEGENVNWAYDEVYASVDGYAPALLD